MGRSFPRPALLLGLGAVLSLSAFVPRGGQHEKTPVADAAALGRAASVSTTALGSRVDVAHRRGTFEGLGFSVAGPEALLSFQRVGRAVIDDSGLIGMFSYTPAGGWAGPSAVYDSQYDDRNAAGGMTRSGAIICFFGRYDAARDVWIDMGYVRSEDGVTWSRYRTIDAGTDRWYSPYGPLVVLPSGRLMQTFYGDDGFHSRVFVMFSDDDGRTWHSRSVVTSSTRLRVTEAAAALLDGAGDASARLVLIVRTESSGPEGGGGLLQFRSADGGRRWSFVDAVPVSDSPSDVAPWLGRVGDTVILLYTARGSMTIDLSAQPVEAAWNGDWSQGRTIYRSVAADREFRPAGSFGYPSFALVDGRPIVVAFDALRTPLFPGDESTPSDTDLIAIALEI